MKKSKKWIVESWDSGMREWEVEAEFNNELDASSYYVNLKFDYRDIDFRVREIEE